MNNCGPTYGSDQSWKRKALSGPWPVILLLGLFWVMALSAQADKSPGVDEVPHLTGGYSYWVADDFRLQPENGNLSQRWIALPLLFRHYRFPSLDQQAWVKGDVWTVGYEFFYRMNNDTSVMLSNGRAMVAFLAVGLGAVVYRWSRILFGPIGGLISLVLFVFSPSVLAHGSLMTSDLPVAAFLTAAVWSLWTMLHHITIRTVIIGALALAGVVLTKLTGLLILPITIVLLLVRVAGRRPLRVTIAGEFHVLTPFRQAAVLGVILVMQWILVFAMVWTCYEFRYSAFGPVRNADDQFIQPWEEVLRDTGRLTPLIQLARDHHLLPEAYLYGLSYAARHMAARRAFLNGDYRVQGWWHFFAYCLLVKTPLPLFMLLLCAAGGAVIMRGYSRGGVGYDTIPLWVLLGVYWIFALSSRLNIGERHILSTYPAMFVLAGAAASGFRMPSRWMKATVVACLGWFVMESLSIRPHYLAYFNQIAGGPAHGFRHLVDSSLDWGQDLPGLKQWLQVRGLLEQDRTPVYLGYFGTGSPAHEGLTVRMLPNATYASRSPVEEALRPLAGGVYCVSATMLQTIPIRYWGPWTEGYERVYQTVLADVETYRNVEGDPQRWQNLMTTTGPEFWKTQLEMFDELRFARLLSYLRKREPDDQVGYSILIYRLSEEAARLVTYGPSP